MSRVFLDTVGLVALWDTSDQWHAAAEAAFAKIPKAGLELVTTTFILMECGNVAARRPYRLAVDRLREQLDTSDGLVVPTADDWNLAWQSYRQDQADRAGIVDHISFVVIRRMGISDAFTNDRHFRAAGFTTLF